MEVHTIDSMSIITSDTHRTERWRFGPIFSRSRNATVMNRNEVNLNDLTQELVPWYKCINVEPIIFTYSFIFGLLIPITPLFLFFARCVEIFSDSVPNDGYADIRNVSRFCANLQRSNNTAAINEVDADIATMRIYLQIGSTLSTVCMAPIIGAWADCYGRRRPFITVFLGFQLYIIAQVLGVYFFQCINVFYFFLAAEISSGLCGGLVSLSTLALSIVSDDARADKSLTPSSVPIRVMIACACQSLGVLAGTAATSVVEMIDRSDADDHVWKYLFLFSTALVLTAIAFICTILFMKDSYKSAKFMLSPAQQVFCTFKSSHTHDFVRGHVEDYIFMLEMNEHTAEVLGLSPVEPPVRRNVIGSAIDSFTGIIRIVSMPRPGWMRFCLNMCIAFVVVEFFTYDTQITCLLVKRPPFEWSDALFSNFILARFAMMSLGTLMIPPIIRRTTLIGKESYLILFGLVSSILGNVFFAFSQSTVGIFATISFNFFGGSIQTGNRTLLPKLVSQEQTARLFSLVGMVLVICPLISTLILNYMYKVTMDWWPGFVFMIQAVFLVFILVGQIFVHMLLRPMWQGESTIDGTEPLLANALDELLEDDEDMGGGRVAAFNAFSGQHSHRSISENAVNSCDTDIS